MQPGLLRRCLRAPRTEGRHVRWRVAVELVDADDSVVGAGREVAAIWREADGVDGAQMVAHVTELSRFVKALFGGIVDGLGRPHPDVAIWLVALAARSYQEGSVS